MSCVLTSSERKEELLSCSVYSCYNMSNVSPRSLILNTTTNIMQCFPTFLQSRHIFYTRKSPRYTTKQQFAFTQCETRACVVKHTQRSSSPALSHNRVSSVDSPVKVNLQERELLLTYSASFFCFLLNTTHISAFIWARMFPRTQFRVRTFLF